MPSSVFCGPTAYETFFRTEDFVHSRNITGRGEHLQGWTPAFPKLEEIIIDGHPHTITRKYKDVYARFISGSPVLNAVTNFLGLGSMRDLQCIFPDDTYFRLLKTYDLDMLSPGDELKWLKIAGAGPALESLGKFLQSAGANSA